MLDRARAEVAALAKRRDDRRRPQLGTLSGVIEALDRAEEPPRRDDPGPTPLTPAPPDP